MPRENLQKSVSQPRPHEAGSLKILGRQLSPGQKNLWKIWVSSQRERIQFQLDFQPLQIYHASSKHCLSNALQVLWYCLRLTHSKSQPTYIMSGSITFTFMFRFIHVHFVLSKEGHRSKCIVYLFESREITHIGDYFYKIKIVFRYLLYVYCI